MPSSSGFRFAAKNVLLTWSQVSAKLTLEEVVFTLLERLGSFEYSVGLELHEDGGVHFHALLAFKDKLDTRDVTIFDIPDPDRRVPDFHPNIKPVKRGKKHFDAAHEYVEKDGDFICTFPHKLTWGEILEKASCGTEYLQLVKDNYPKEYCLNLQRLEYVAQRTYGLDLNTILDTWRPHSSYTVPATLCHVVLPSERSLVLVGAPGIGKTTWAKSVIPKPALFVRHLDSLRNLRDDHRAIIFDDLEFAHLPVSTQKFLVDLENVGEIHVRYGVARIPARLPRIFTANDYPFTQGGVHGEAIARRVQLVNL